MLPPDTMMAAWSAAILAPIMAEMAAVRQAGERKDDLIRDQAGQLGKLTERIHHMTAELEALKAAHAE